MRRFWGERRPSSEADAVTVVGIMDREGWTERTDNMVVVDAPRRTLTWIPRDLWSEVVGDRINEAFGRGGHALLQRAVRQLGFAASGSLVLLRSVTERALRDLQVTVPVARPLRYWYPLAPQLRLQDGRKLVEFHPPTETLTGERIHQWIGARTSADPVKPALPDLDRIARQQLFVRAVLESRFDFASLLDDASRCSLSHPEAVHPLAAVTAAWSMRTLDDVVPAEREGKRVLEQRRGRWHRLWRNRRA